MTLESLTVDQLGALCGLERDSMGQWTLCGGSTQWSDPCVLRNADGWIAVAGKYPVRISCITTEHAALLALARHMNLTPKDDTVPTYKRIERDPITKSYPRDYASPAGDILCFPDGQRWTIRNSIGIPCAGPDEFPHAVVVGKPLLSLTSHIERPVRTVTVPKEGYVPRVGDRLCGPAGPVMTFECPTGNFRFMLRAANAPFGIVDDDGLNALIALCHHIERDEG